MSESEKIDHENLESLKQDVDFQIKNLQSELEKEFNYAKFQRLQELKQMSHWIN